MDRDRISEKPGFLSDISLKASGCAFLLGDAALFVAGLMEKNYKAGAAGLLWSIGGLATAWYGNPSQEKRLALLTDDLGQYLRAQGITIPHHPDTKMLSRDQTLIDHVHAYFYQHPVHLLNASGFLGATQLLHAGITRKFKPDIASGILVGAATLSGLLIPEKPRDPNAPSQGMISDSIGWIQEKPLRITGALQAANNASMFWSAYAKGRDAPQKDGFNFRYVAAASYLFANAMLFISSKDNRETLHPDTLHKLALISAQVISAQPAELQHTLILKVSEHLAENIPDMTPKDFCNILKKQLADMDRDANLKRHTATGPVACVLQR